MNTPMGRPVSLVSFGEILWDIIGDECLLGGAALNLAAHAARLGLHARLLSCVGEDDLGRRACREAAQLGVDIGSVQRSAQYPTGTVHVTIVDGQPEYDIKAPAAWDFIEAADPGNGNAADVICFGTLSQRNDVSRQALRSLLHDHPIAPTFYDVNLRQDYYSRDIVELGFRRASVIKVNDAESSVISSLLFGADLSPERFSRRVHTEYGVQIVLTTLGPEGCLVSSRDGFEHVPGHAVAVRDTVGAGDAFSAAFLAAWLQGESPTEAAALGNRLGAFIATQRGAVPPYPAALSEQLTTRIASGQNAKL